MSACARCGNVHAPGPCPLFPRYTDAARPDPTPAYAEVMRHLGARTVRTDGSGNQCLFFALAGEVSADGTVRERDGRAAALRTRAGALMRQGYARCLSREGDGEWLRHVDAMERPRLRWLPGGSGQATVSACAAAWGRDIVRAAGRDAACHTRAYAWAV